MARARKPIGDDKELPVDTSSFGFEDDEQWKVGWYEGNNLHRHHSCLPSELEAVSIPSLFTPDVRVELENDFELTEAQVIELARRVEAALDPDLTPLALFVAQSDGTRRGTAAVERGFVALSDAQERITGALEAFTLLRAVDENGDAGGTLGSLLDALQKGQSSVLEALIILDEKLRHRGQVYQSVVADKRQVDNSRRAAVLAAIFEFWAWTGRRVTCTTAWQGKLKNGKYRSGLLLDLCERITQLTRKDGRSIEGETVAQAIRAWNKR